MTAPMTAARLAQIRAATAQTKAMALSGAWMSEGYLDREELIAEIDRLRALPVLRTCGECGWHLDDRGGRDCVYPGRRWVVGAPDNSVPPPSWCPFRGGER